MIEIKKKIEKILDELINDAQNVINNIKVIERTDQKELKKNLWEKLEETQMRNILEIALSVDSIKAIELFIEYQIGRKKIPKEFGELIIEKIDKKLHKYANEISQKIGVDVKNVKLEIIRQNLGYLNRYFVYKAKI